MRDRIAPPNFPRPRDQFDPSVVDDHNRQLTLFLLDLLSAGEVDVSTLRILSVPTSTSGLTVGSVFSDNNALKIVLGVVAFEPTGLSVTTSVGAVTVLTP